MHSVVPSFTPERVLEALERDRITDVLLVPTMIQMLVDHPAMQQPRDLSALRLILYGASPMAEAYWVARWRRCQGWGSCKPTA